MAIIHDDVHRESCNVPTTPTLKCTSGEKVPSPRRRRLHVSDESFTVQKKMDDFQNWNFRIEFLNSVTRRTQIDKNLSSPLNSVSTTSKRLCPPTPSPHAASLDSTHSPDSDTSTYSLQISSISKADLLPRQFHVLF
jgi:hypothetical protein